MMKVPTGLTNIAKQLNELECGLRVISEYLEYLCDEHTGIDADMKHLGCSYLTSIIADDADRIQQGLLFMHKGQDGKVNHDTSRL
jgi:hypothetical protein